MRIPLWIALLVSLMTAPKSHACSCEQQTVDDAVRSAASVFLGETIAANVVETEEGRMVLEVTVKDIVYLKGQGDEVRRIYSPASSAACGRSVSVPRSMWFFISEDGEFTKCDPNMLSTDRSSFPLFLLVKDRFIEMKKRSATEP